MKIDGSSTFPDLAERRQAVDRTLRRAHDVSGLAPWVIPAEPCRPPALMTELPRT
jgi:hypothetical protein